MVDSAAGQARREGGPLAGLLVADFSRVLAGPYATMLLADLGAEVIKVESPQGDETRTWTPPARGETSTYYLSINRGKRSIVLDLRDEADAELGRELARRADVVIQNFKPGGLERFGLDYPSVRTANPGVVYTSISGFGAAGGAHLPGYDLMVQAISGLMSLTGEPDGPPYRAGISVVDVFAGNHAAIGILAALRHRDASGEGQHVEVNLLSSALTGMVNQSSAYAAGGVVPYRMGNAHPSVYPYEPFPTADRDMIIAVANNGQFRTLCEVLGIPELAVRPPVPQQLRPHREPGGAAPADDRAAGHPGRGGVVSTRWWPPGCPAGRSTPSTAASRWPTSSGSSPSWRWATATGRCRPPATRSGSPPPRSPIGCPRRSWTSTEPSCASGWPPRRTRTAADRLPGAGLSLDLRGNTGVAPMCGLRDP